MNPKFVKLQQWAKEQGYKTKVSKDKHFVICNQDRQITVNASCVYKDEFRIVEHRIKDKRFYEYWFCNFNMLNIKKEILKVIDRKQYTEIMKSPLYKDLSQYAEKIFPTYNIEKIKEIILFAKENRILHYLDNIFMAMLISCILNDNVELCKLIVITGKYRLGGKTMLKEELLKYAQKNNKTKMLKIIQRL